MAAFHCDWAEEPGQPGLFVCRSKDGARLATVHKVNSLLSFGWLSANTDKFKLVFCFRMPGLPMHGSFFASLDDAKDYANPLLARAHFKKAHDGGDRDALLAVIAQQHAALQAALKSAPLARRDAWTSQAQAAVSAATPFI